MHGVLSGSACTGSLCGDVAWGQGGVVQGTGAGCACSARHTEGVLAAVAVAAAQGARGAAEQVLQAAAQLGGVGLEDASRQAVGDPDGLAWGQVGDRLGLGLQAASWQRVRARQVSLEAGPHEQALPQLRLVAACQCCSHRTGVDSRLQAATCKLPYCKG